MPQVTITASNETIKLKFSLDDNALILKHSEALSFASDIIEAVQNALEHKHASERKLQQSFEGFLKANQIAGKPKNANMGTLSDILDKLIDQIEISSEERKAKRDAATEKSFYGTFGHGHPNQGCYVKIKANDTVAASEFMRRHFEDNWAHVYDSADDAGIEKFNLKELKIEDPT